MFKLLFSLVKKKKTTNIYKTSVTQRRVRFFPHNLHTNSLFSGPAELS